MEWNTILTQIVYPLVFIVLAALATKVLIPWLQKLAKKTDNDLLKQGAFIAVTAVQEAADFAKKKGEDGWSSDTKQEKAEKDLTEFAKNNKLKPSPEDITKMIKSVLGEKRL